jgi:hypothetical protein
MIHEESPFEWMIRKFATMQVAFHFLEHTGNSHLVVCWDSSLFTFLRLPELAGIFQVHVTFSSLNLTLI